MWLLSFVVIQKSVRKKTAELQSAQLEIHRKYLFVDNHQEIILPDKCKNLELYY